MGCTASLGHIYISLHLITPPALITTFPIPLQAGFWQMNEVFLLFPEGAVCCKAQCGKGLLLTTENNTRKILLLIGFPWPDELPTPI